MSRVCQAGQPPVAKRLMLDIMHKLFNQILLTTFTDFDLAVGSQGQCKAKPVGFIFAHFSTGPDEIWCSVEAIQAKHPDTLFEWDLMKREK